MSDLLNHKPEIVSSRCFFSSASDGFAAPVGPDGFQAAADACGPFEPRPDVALAVSGGCDSMALMLLMRDWLAMKGGRGFVLTVDHGLRTAAAAETGMVEAWATRLGFSCAVLKCRIEAATAGLQNAARCARYAVLRDWCRRSGVLHLFLAHHRDDQAETFLMRHLRGSGPAGLAAMPAIAEQTGLRLLRPLLPFNKARLTMTCRVGGQDWVEDSSNRQTVHERVRWRMVMPIFADQGYDSRRLSDLARRAGERRIEIERRVASLMAAAVTVYPQGYAYLNPEALRQAEPETARSMIAAVLRMVAGAEHGPRRDRLETLMSALTLTGSLSARTLHGCWLLPPAGRRGWLICREPASAREELPAHTGQRLFWDGRFVILNGRFKELTGAIWARLGEDGWKQIAGDIDKKAVFLPYPVRLALPALWRNGKVLYAPHFDLAWPGLMARDITESTRLYFLPGMPAAPSPFAPLRMLPSALS